MKIEVGDNQLMDHFKSTLSMASLITGARSLMPREQDAAQWRQQPAVQHVAKGHVPHLSLFWQGAAA
jgi:hypothetical protein